MKRGRLAESPKTARSLQIAVCKPSSNSTNGVTPELRAQLISRHDLARPLQERDQEAKRQILYLDQPPPLLELTSRDINFKLIESDYSSCLA